MCETTDPSLDATPPKPHAPPAPSSGLWEAVVWAALVAAVVAIVALNQPEGSGGEFESMEFRLSARYSLGVKTLFGALDESLGATMGEELLGQLEQQAHTPAQRLGLIPLTAELAGPGEALERLATLRGDEALDAGIHAELELLERLYRDPAAELSGAQRAALRARHGWFAELALSRGKPADDPERRAVIGPAIRVAVTLLGMLCGGLLVTGVGLVLLVLGGIRFSQGGVERVYPRATARAVPQRTPYLETVVLLTGGFGGFALLAARFPELTRGAPRGLIPALAIVAVVLVLLWPRWRGLDRRDLATALGCHSGRGVWREMGSGLVAYVAGLPILILGVILALVTALLLGTKGYHPIVEGFGTGNPWRVVMIYGMACVWAPVVEEAVFRGYFYHYLRGRAGVGLSTAAVATVFAVIHPQGISGLPPLMALAAVLTLTREWRGSLIASVTIHAVHNGLAVTAALLLLG
ncbi:MAG: CPBP family intramembrane metalloprotease [bacterium]|nr:CPBP family intramembrane metalloprotease [bacterium]